MNSQDLVNNECDSCFKTIENLYDCDIAKQIDMTRFATDGLWRPTASESSGYAFPSQMFFKYMIEIQE